MLYLSAPETAADEFLSGIVVMAGFLWFATDPEAGALLAAVVLEAELVPVTAVPLLRDAGALLVTVVLFAAALSELVMPVDGFLVTVVLTAPVLPDDCARETEDFPADVVLRLTVLLLPRPPRSDELLAKTLPEPVWPLVPCHTSF